MALVRKQTEDVGLPAQKAKLLESCIRPYSHRMFQLRLACKLAAPSKNSIKQRASILGSLGHLQAIVDQEQFARNSDPQQLSTAQWRSIKTDGFSDKQLGVILGLIRGERSPQLTLAGQRASGLQIGRYLCC